MPETVAGPVAGAGREVILASAGSGKTYRLTSCLIGLLSIGVPPEEILASTFTRKAAGEIVDRALTRLAEGALDSEAARELEGSMPPWVPEDRLDREGCRELLGSTVHRLHRLQVHTLDAFFHRVAHAFALELGLPEGWTVAADPDREQLRSRAIEEALGEMESGVVLELVRMISRDGADRDVHRLLVSGVAELHHLFRDLDPAAADPWGFDGGGSAFGDPDPAELDLRIRQLEEVGLPLTVKGVPDGRWMGARDAAVAALREGDWSRFCRGGWGGALLEGKDHFAGRDIPEDLAQICEALFRMARRSLGSVLHRRISALGRFLVEYDGRLSRVSRDAALYHFDDLTHALASGGGLGRGEELFYRLDGRLRHVLLDEFQDTSNGQWAALAPLVGEILSGYEGERVAFIVADPKQSIYGWRGGEPRILEGILQTYGIEPDSMARSWRSSQVVLNAVNRVFAEVEANPVLAEDPATRKVAARWAEAFEPHHAARDLPGYVRLEAGPREEGRPGAGLRPRLLAHAADRVVRLQEWVPGVTIGVLTRTNRSAALLIALLRQRGVEASEEGGVPIADSAPVLALLALLRLADHPEDLISRYMVSRTAVGDLVGLGPDTLRHDGRVERAARDVRGRLLAVGYGRVIAGWVRTLSPGVPERDRRRLRQLAELAFRWDARATLRPTDFVRAVESARAEDPATAAVRVMTVHRAKGLEFDAVVLPELDGLSLAGKVEGSYLSYRPVSPGPATRILPRVSKNLLPLFPELEPAVLQARELVLRDSLSNLYVGLTRARHALYLLVSPDPSGKSHARTGARFVRAALAPDGGGEEGAVLFEEGDPAWWSSGGHEVSHAKDPWAGHGAREAHGRLVAPAGPRRRLLPRQAPSDLEGGDRILLDRILRTGSGAARDRGGLVHAWLESIEWLPEGDAPEEDALAAIARERAPQLGDLRGLVKDFQRWIRVPELRRFLSRDAFPPGTRVDRELPFLVREGSRLVQGSVDRLIRIPEPEGDRLVVVDWKTDALEPGESPALEERLRFYRPQLEAYMRALARSEGVPSGRIIGVLAFLAAEVAREV